jgi:hypothetical protein
LRRIDALLSKKFLATRYDKLPDDARFLMVVAFEGERECGTRHAHILVRIPLPVKKRISHSMLKSIFVSEFMFLWRSPTTDQIFEIWPIDTESEPLVFERANAARATYTVKDVGPIDLSWSRFEFVTPPKFKPFKNENLSVLQNRDHQKRITLGLANHVA